MHNWQVYPNSKKRPYFLIHRLYICDDTNFLVTKVTISKFNSIWCIDVKYNNMVKLTRIGGK